MRSVTHPLFPAQVAGAVTLQDVIDAREGDRLPLELALYVSGEVGKQVAQLESMGRQGALDPKRVWCTSKGAVVVHEAQGTTDPHALSDLVYRLLSGSGDVSAWPPSYFNPSVDDSIDAAVMRAVNGEQPEAKQALVETVTSAANALDPEAAVDGMARLVFAVEPKPAEPAPAPRAAEPVSAPAVPVTPIPWITPRRTAIAAAAALAMLLLTLVLSVSKTPEPVVVAPPPPPPASVLTPALREKAVEAQKPAKTAAPPKRATRRK